MKKKDNYKAYLDWIEKGIVPNRFIWWLYRIQFWKYKQIMKGVLIKK